MRGSEVAWIGVLGISDVTEGGWPLSKSCVGLGCMCCSSNVAAGMVCSPCPWNERGAGGREVKRKRA